MIDPSSIMATIPVFHMIDSKIHSFFESIKQAQKEPKSLMDLRYINDDINKTIKEILFEINKEEKIITQAKIVVQSRFIVDFFKAISDKYNLNFDSMFQYLSEESKTLFYKASKNIDM